MLRRLFPILPLTCALFGLEIGLEGRAHAAGAWVPSAALEPIEQRVALSTGPDRSTLWTSLRFEQAAPGPVAIVIPAPEGASLDISSDAWFEALEVATAPRIFPPENASPYCPGVDGPTPVFEIAGHTDHAKSLSIDDVSVLDDVSALDAWATQGGLTLPSGLATTLSTMSGVRFVALRFQAPSGASLTPTLRVAMPGASPYLPLALTSAGSNDLRVVSWFIGPGVPTVVGSVTAWVMAPNVTWDASTTSSNYEEEREALLSAAGGDASVRESASHEALSHNISIANGTASIDGVATSFFERAAAYGDGAADPALCAAKAAAALSSSGLVSTSCPRADLGTVGNGTACAESPQPGTIDPAALRCGGLTDDLAVALSGLSPAGVWLTREVRHIEAGKSGLDWPVQFGDGTSASPVRHAWSVDVSQCFNSSSSSSSSSTGAGASSSSSGTPGNASTGSGWNGGGSGAGGSDDPGYGYVDTGCSCSGTGDPYYYDDGSSCSGDSSGDSCSGDSSGDSCSGDSSYDGDTCSGDSSGGDSCDGGSSYDGDTCDSGGSSGDVDCSGGGDSADCSVSSRRNGHRRGPKLSAMAFGLLALLAPLRRRGRKSRRRSA